MKEVFIDFSEKLAAPPVVPDGKFRNWFSMPRSDPLIEHLSTILWNQEITPNIWQAARLSSNAYIFREKTTGWKIVAKFFATKTGEDAFRHSGHEYQCTQQAWDCLGPDQELRSVQPLGVWGGVLFVEFIDGLTLEDKIVIRRSQPGELYQSLENVGKLLSKLHTFRIQKKSSPDFGPTADYTYKLIDNLAKHGVLQNHPAVQCGLGKLIEKWAKGQLMWDFPLALNHGDATTTNFIFPADGGAAAIDWERSEFADPAADLGRLMAEVTHCVNKYGGNFSEGDFFANELAAAYCKEGNLSRNLDNLVHRARFYQAASTLRMARNGWLSRKDRLALVLQAFALFSQDVSL